MGPQMSQLLLRPGILTVALLIVSTARADPAKDPPEAMKPVPGKEAGADTDEDYRLEAARLVDGIELQALVAGQWINVKRIEKPLLYYTDATRGHTRGSVWAWGETGRPVALLELWQNRSDRAMWAFGLCNTSGEKLRASRLSNPWWRENDSAIELKQIPSAPVPAVDSSNRQRQLKILVQRFAGHEFWDPNNSRYELRRLERPLLSYRDEAHGLLEGAMYALANGTNPEMALFVEARLQPESKAAPAWHFLIGRLSHAELHLEYDSKEVFSGPRGRTLSGRDKPYWVSYIAPIP